MEIYTGLTENEIRAVEELANKGGRSYADIAKAVGISERQLYRVRQKPHIKKAVRERVMQELEDDVPDILSALRRGMRKGDYRSTELLAKMAGLLVERSEVTQKTTIEDNRYAHMSDDDIDRELAKLDQELKVIQGGAK
ncbi:phBC6A51 family helix-turn-helix protein [Priestia aryabhattai]|uniref:PhBC6A51 family helix-turn-helix protein n=1 Tax=Priestia aryabhattai TaxID=412384 RepID=A0ABD7WU84_PRIAR|nr:phBC6A51 family helix-turn-helix protein [Priestia aryabhattai]WEA43808.1 phBC6A51 family helix-turn-helix protein [Priestia aryabhattai]